MKHQSLESKIVNTTKQLMNPKIQENEEGGLMVINWLIVINGWILIIRFYDNDLMLIIAIISFCFSVFLSFRIKNNRKKRMDPSS